MSMRTINNSSQSGKNNQIYSGLYIYGLLKGSGVVSIDNRCTASFLETHGSD